MPQRTITIPKYIDKLFVKVSAETGRSISSIIAQCAEAGLFEMIGDINKAAVFLSMESRRQEQRVNLGEEEKEKEKED